MPKVIRSGAIIPRVVEVEVPSMEEFRAAIARAKQEFQEINDNKQALWDLVNQLKSELLGPRPDNKWTAWQCIEAHGERLDKSDERLKALPDALRDTVREAVRTVLEPLLDEDRTLQEEIASLRTEVNDLKAIISSKCEQTNDGDNLPRSVSVC